MVTMEPEQILRKAIEKAKKNGFFYPRNNLLEYIPVGMDIEIKENAYIEIIKVISRNYHKLIFSHSFAKAFWNEDHHSWHRGKCEDCGQLDNRTTTYCWQYYLRQLAITPDNKRIKYLEKFL